MVGTRTVQSVRRIDLFADDTGKIPANQFVDIRWVVNLQGQQIFVDGQLRYEDKLSNLGLNRPVSVFPAVGSIVTVKKLEVTPLKQGNW